MIRKRIHKLKFKEVVSSGSTKDENGDWIPGTSIENDVILICRAKPNSKGKTVKNNDGQDFIYSFSIYLDSIPESLKKGVQAEILLNNKVFAKGEVIMPWTYQTTKKIWI